MIWLSWLLACAPDPTTGTDPYRFVPFEGVAAEPDALTDRLCAEAADPEGAPDKVFIDCRVEGANLASADPAPVDTLAVVAWNLERGFHLADQVAQLEALDADVLLISEADRGCARTDGVNVPWEVASALGLNYAYGVEFVELPRPEPMGLADDSCEHGNFVASRYPIGNVDVFRHAANLSWYEDGERRLGGRVAVAADVKVGERLLHVTAVHFESNIVEIEVQVAQAEETAIRALDRPIPALVGGDMNAPLYGADLIDGTTRDGTTQAFLTRGFADTHLELPVEARATIEPGFVIDLMFSTAPTSEPGVCETSGCGGLSDHRAIWADVTLEP